jgi:phage terminase large subunit-like protein
MATIAEELRDNFEEFFIQAFARTHPDGELDFAPYLEYVCDVYQHIKAGDRILFNQPPRSLKSWTAKFFAAWFLGRKPSKTIMFASNIQDLAELNLRDVKSIIQSRWFKQVFPETRIAKGSSANRFTTTRQGGLIAVSLQGSLAGFGADLLIIDDANKISDASRPDRLQKVNEKYDGELYSRLNNKRKGIVIGLQHRLGDNDLSGHLLAQGFRQIALPLIAPQRKTFKFEDGRTWVRESNDILTDTYLPRDIALAKEAQTPDFFWFYQQGKGRRDLKTVPLSAFKFARYRIEDGPFVLSLDTAQSDGPANSFNVIQAWQQIGNGFHLYDQFRSQCGFKEVQAATKNMINKYRPFAVLIENTANGSALSSVLRAQFPRLNIVAITPRKSKQERLGRHLAKICRNLLTLQQNVNAAVDFMLEFARFGEAGLSTDMVDATTQMLDFAETNPVWLRSTEPITGIAGVYASTGQPIRPIISSNNTGVRGIAVARGKSFFRR